jgi:class 3 adenylate cyclase
VLLEKSSLIGLLRSIDRVNVNKLYPIFKKGSNRMSATPCNFCILFGDVAGSTRLYEKLGDAEALRAVELCLNCMERFVTLYKGRVVKTIGDELMVAFSSAEDGFHAACDMQTDIDGLPPVLGNKLAIRIGFHFGPVLLEEDGDVFGDTVNMASRLTSLAKGGQIMTSGDTLACLPTLLQQSTRLIDMLNVKGKVEAVAVHEVLWEDASELTMMTYTERPNPAVSSRLQLRYNGLELLMGADRTSVTLGRDANSDLIILNPSASRRHGKIEKRRDKFVLIDQSTNGTFVTIEGEADSVLKHEELILHGHGCFGFGDAYQGIKQEVVSFEVLS